jgi:hypothetical protein
MKIVHSLAGLLFVAALAIGSSALADSTWIKVDEGLYRAEFIGAPASTVGDSRIEIIRIDPKLYEVKVMMVSETKGPNLTAKEWCQQYGLLAATNAGMFQTDGTTHVGYLKHDNHVNCGKSTSSYLSAAAFNPIDSTLPLFRIFDLDETPLEYVKANYQTVIQNLRLIKRPGHNTWSQQEKMWSEAALGEDKRVNFKRCVKGKKVA